MTTNKPTCEVCLEDAHDPTAYVCDQCRRRLAKRILRTATIWPALIAACGKLDRRTVAGHGAPKPLGTLAGPTCRDCRHPSCHATMLSQALAEIRANRIAREEPAIAHEEGILVSLAAIEAHDVAWNTLQVWARHVAEMRSLDLADREVFTFLARQSDWLMHRREAATAYDEIIAACQKAEGAVDNIGVDMAFCGPCDVCGRDMFAPAGAEEAHCAPCDVTYQIGPRRDQLIEHLDSQIMTAVELARALTTTGGRGVTPAIIANWSNRGRLLPRGLNTRGHRLYAVKDVRELIRARDERSARTRKKPRRKAS